MNWYEVGEKTEEQLDNYSHGIKLLCPISGAFGPVGMFGNRPAPR